MVLAVEKMGLNENAQDSEIFSQSDWEFQLDTLQDYSEISLARHLKASGGTESGSSFLHGYLLRRSSFADTDCCTCLNMLVLQPATCVKQK